MLSTYLSSSCIHVHHHAWYHLISRHECARPMSAETHLRCFPTETTSIFQSWCLVFFSIYTNVSRISACVCNTHVKGNTSPMFSHWNHFVVSVSRYLVLSYTVVSRTSARMCHTHVNGDTSPMFSYWHHFIVSVHGYLMISCTVVSRTSAPVLPPFCILSIYWLSSTPLLVISTDLLRMYYPY